MIGEHSGRGVHALYCALHGVSWRIMPSWNIHTAHVQKLLESATPEELGIADANVFLFGNYVPDIYLGFMVSNTTYRIHYCLTHLAEPCTTPVPDADLFWDRYVCRFPLPPEGLSLALGAWAHLLADRMYNGRFRCFTKEITTPKGDKLREAKQADFNAFGRSLPLSARVTIDDALLEAAERFRPYSILKDDVIRTVAKADEIVAANETPVQNDSYHLLGEDWMLASFNAYDVRLRAWLKTWQRLSEAGLPVKSTDIRTELGLPAAEQMETDVMQVSFKRR